MSETGCRQTIGGINPGLATSPRRRLEAEVHWPIRPAELAALVDIGMTNELIATYFGVAPSLVVALCDRYNLRD